MQPEQADDYRQSTEKMNMLGVATTPLKAVCYACRRYRTTITGKVTKKGNFLCCDCKKLV